jgi:hypothetical protein
MADLTTEEHDGLDNAGRQEQHALTMTRALVEHVRADERECQGEEPVMKIRQPEPARLPERDQDDNAAYDEQRDERRHAAGTGTSHEFMVACRRPRAGQGFPCFPNPGFSSLVRDVSTSQRWSRQV